MKPHWELNDLHWDQLTPAAVSPALLQTVKTAALIEANSSDYVSYLHNVFAGDDSFRRCLDRARVRLSWSRAVHREIGRRGAVRPAPAARVGGLRPKADRIDQAPDRVEQKDALARLAQLEIDVHRAREPCLLWLLIGPDNQEGARRE